MEITPLFGVFYSNKTKIIPPPTLGHYAQMPLLLFGFFRNLKNCPLKQLSYTLGLLSPFPMGLGMIVFKKYAGLIRANYGGRAFVKQVVVQTQKNIKTL